MIKSSRQRIESVTTAFLGEVPVRDVKFDPSRRKEIETSVIDQVAGIV
jgi:hypothetical protein